MEIQPKNNGSLNYYSSPNQNSFFDNLGTRLIDFIQTLVVCGAIFVLIYLFVAQPHKVSGRSMVPNFQDGDFILTDKLSYRFDQPKRGDVIVLKNPKSESQEFIKRIIAVPGDSIQILNGNIYLNGERLNEKYLPAEFQTDGAGYLREGEILKVENNQYIVLGDNRQYSSDSRQWGPITREEIVGRTFFRYWPPKSIGLTTL